MQGKITADHGILILRKINFRRPGSARVKMSLKYGLGIPVETVSMNIIRIAYIALIKREE
ncbi:MAG: hypothetical protein HY274_06265 [Gammaproteobacteria bacterium]|nr:hypothetical protein [Gammaproteobacteria bacterium]